MHKQFIKDTQGLWKENTFILPTFEKEKDCKITCSRLLSVRRFKSVVLSLNTVPHFLARFVKLLRALCYFRIPKENFISKKNKFKICERFSNQMIKCRMAFKRPRYHVTFCYWIWKAFNELLNWNWLCSRESFLKKL